MAVPAGTGRTAVHLLAFYGYSGARSNNAWAKEANERAIRQVFRYAAALDGVPVLAAGDWNDDPERSPALEEALQLGCSLLLLRHQTQFLYPVVRADQTAP